MVIGAQPGPGVFIYATTDDPVSKRFLGLGKLGEGPLYCFYVPYHLLFFEFPFSIVRLVDFADSTLDAKDAYFVEVMATAKKRMRAGEMIDGIGGYCVYGQCENRREMVGGHFLPVGICEGLRLRKDVLQDQVLTWDDVIFDPDDPIVAAYRSF